MSNNLTIVLSGRKQSGKTSTCNYILAKYLNLVKSKCYRFTIDGTTGDLICIGSYIDSSSVEVSPVNDDALARYSVKRYSFADELKKFCVNVLNVPYESCWGTDVQKNAPVPHILWENFPRECRPVEKVFHDSKFQEFSGIVRESWSEERPKTGPMTGREIMQVFGTNIVRRIYGDCWARATYNAIKNDGYKLAVVTDGRFPNEIDLGEVVNAKSIRLLRAISNDDHRSEIALDDYPLHKYTAAVDNRYMTQDEQCRYLDPILDQWFKEAGIA
jgi:hypothetical protein